MTANQFLGASIAAIVVASVPSAAYAQQTYSFNVPAQKLADSLRAIGAHSGTSVAFDPALTRGKKAPAVKGVMGVSQALGVALHDSGLQARKSGSGFIVGADLGNALAGAPNAGAEISSSSSVDDAATSDATPSEIIITAQRRAERLIDAPQSVTALTGQQLEQSGAIQFKDFANKVPGLTFATAGAGYTQISLRGVTTGVDIGPTVAVYVDDVPYGSSSAFGGANVFSLDFGLFDLNRVEVLRGPQGTLYGASSMGGVIRYITNEPDLNTFSGRARAAVSNTWHGGIGGALAATVNDPLLKGKAALRATGYAARDGGYIDNVGRNKDDVNKANIYGGRVDLLFAPAPALKVRVTALAQELHRNGEATVDYSFAGNPLFGRLDQRRLVDEPFDQSFRLVSGTINYDAGAFALTSISSYQWTKLDYGLDVSRSNVPLFQRLLGRTGRHGCGLLSRSPAPRRSTPEAP